MYTRFYLREQYNQSVLSIYGVQNQLGFDFLAYKSMITLLLI